MSETTEPEVALKRALFAVLFSGVLLTLGAFVLWDGQATLSVFFGGVAAAVNLLAIAFLVRGFLNPGATPLGVRIPWTLVALFKLAALTGGAYLLLSQGYVRLLPLALGYAALPLGIVFGQGAAGHSRTGGETGRRMRKEA